MLSAMHWPYIATFLVGAIVVIVFVRLYFGGKDDA